MATITDKRIQHSSDNTTIDYFMPDVVAEQEYYAFGALMPGRSVNTAGYRYGFNGKENDNDVGKGTGNQINFGSRVYDSRIGRWLSTDIITKPFGSPYGYSANDPINYLDPDGLDEIHFVDLIVRQYFDGKLIASKATKYSVVIKNNEPNVFVHHKINLRYDGIGNNAKVTNSNRVNTRFYPDAPGNYADRDTLIKYIDEYNLSKQDIDYNYSEFSSPGAAQSDRLKKAKWWAGVFADKAVRDENERIDGINREFVVAGLSFLGSELIVAKLANGGLWLGGLSELGTDGATVINADRLIPKRGWYDVIVHGDTFHVGSAFRIDGKTVGVAEVYNLMLQNGYQKGTSIRLISCDAGWGVAQELANLADAKVIAPMARTKVLEGGNCNGKWI